MKNNLAVFPAIVSFDGNSYNVDFIDLKECSGTGNNIQDACSMAQRKAMKKTLTIPSWLNYLAVEKKINFSQVLQKALKEELGFLD